MSIISRVATFVPLLTLLLMVVPEVVALELVDVEVESLDLPVLILVFFDALLSEQVTINKLFVGIIALGAPKLEITTFCH